MKIPFTKLYGIIGKAVSGCAGAVVGFVFGGISAAIVGTILGIIASHFLGKALTPKQETPS